MTTLALGPEVHLGTVGLKRMARSMEAPAAKSGPARPVSLGAIGRRAAMGRCAACELRDFTFCSALSDVELSSLEAIVTPVRLAAGQLLFQEGDEADCVFNVTSGVMRVYKLLPDGRRQITGFLFAANFLGIATAGIVIANGKNRFTDTGQAAGKSSRQFHKSPLVVCQKFLCLPGDSRNFAIKSCQISYFGRKPFGIL